MAITDAIHAAIELVGAKLAYELEDRQIPGMSVGIVVDQDLIWHQGYGSANIEKGIAANEKTVYRVASITKLFTATMLMQLRDAGKLQLDDPIAKYLTDFAIQSNFPDAKSPTFRQIVSHSSGLPREGTHAGWRDMNMPTIEELIASLADLEMILPTMFEPKYSNLAIAILGHTLSKIAGQTYVEYVQEHILGPLGMTTTGFDRERYSEEEYAISYYLPSRGEPFAPAPHWNQNGFLPAGGMYSTVADMAKFMSLQFRDGEAGGSQILGSSTLREMHSPVLINDNFTVGYGIGFGMRPVANHKVIGHSGGLPGYTTNIAMVPALKLGVLVFTNTGTNPVEISDMMLRTLIPIFEAEEKRAIPKPTPEQLQSWKPYMGRYALRSLDDGIEIKVVDGWLKAVPADGNMAGSFRLEPYDEHRFKMVGGSSQGELMIFETDQNGDVTSLWMGRYPLDRIES
ncbi:beta-lactamase family protein [Phototrophicus methaneseepsis]|uniref:Beta-lactamase family protein n=1 Tax=Phototrophicus methaneseepsis TaxID=2710758 RepID=A0A7S8EBR8_9CHLR|nr:serine hydrolase domain-containing protein [Phototrophicus methaneseepsis]QPC84017.1 beta-lactamase family protein [Phototrophicus methaneseepsis]